MTHLRALERHQGRVLVMGVVNRTPDSFFDGGRFVDDDAARARVDDLCRAGADVIDIGAESTRPGAREVNSAEQIGRLGDLVAWAAQRQAFVSVDTTLPAVAAFALDQGARMINSVSLEPAAELAALAVRYDAELVLTHCRGRMADMPGFSQAPDDAYRDVVLDVAREWQAAADQALSAGVPRARLWLDPGLGFFKSAAQSLELCARLPELKALGFPLLLGPSRKSFLAAAVGDRGIEPPLRMGASIAAALDCARLGADMLRVHDVFEVAQALSYQAAVERTREAALCSRA